MYYSKLQFEGYLICVNLNLAVILNKQLFRWRFQTFLLNLISYLIVFGRNNNRLLDVNQRKAICFNFIVKIKMKNKIIALRRFETVGNFAVALVRLCL